MNNKLRIAMLISGGGTTMQEIVKACQSGALRNVEPICVIASKPTAGGIAKARALGIPEQDILVRTPKSYPNRLAFGEAILADCKERGVDFIGQYGWLCLTPPNVIEAFGDMMVNQHPGPLDPGRPDFGGKGMYGRRVHCARLYYVRKTETDFWTEVVAQRVGVGYDQGAVIGKKTVPIGPKDDITSLQEIALHAEYSVQVDALQDVADGKVTVITRDEPLVPQQHYGVLDEAKRVAAMLFPTG